MKHLTQAEFDALVQAAAGAHARAAQTGDELQAQAEALAARAGELGFVLTIEQVSYPPLAMGRYRDVIAVRPARGAA